MAAKGVSNARNEFRAIQRSTQARADTKRRGGVATIVAFTAIGNAEQLGFHLQRGLENGLTYAWLGEAISGFLCRPVESLLRRRRNHEAQAGNAGAVTHAARLPKLKDIYHGQHHGQR